MRLVFLTESRADLGGLIPVLKEGRRRGHQVRLAYTTFPCENIDWLIFLGDRIGLLREVVRFLEYNQDTGLAHLSGGDQQKGKLIDENVRDALTKLSHLHFPCTSRSACRIKKIDENQDRIFNVGSTLVDDLVDFKPEKKDYKKYYVILIHPAPNWQVDLKEAIETYKPNIVLQPNKDRGFGDFNFDFQPNLERSDFLQLIWNSKAFVGNSSAMYLEAQYLGVPCISIGERNFGREKAFKSHFSSDFRREFGLREGWEKGKHGRGEASKRILDVLERIDKPTREFLFKGSFY